MRVENGGSYETDPSSNKASAPVVHPRRAVVRPLALHPRERVLDMLRPQSRPCLRWWQEQRVYGKGIFDILVWAGVAAPLLGGSTYRGGLPLAHNR